MTDPTHLTIVEASAEIARGALSPVDYVQAHLDRIAALDPHLNAFLHVMGDAARAAARDAEAEIAAGRRLGPLHGVPVAIKDLIDVAGEHTTAHSKILADNIATSDAFVVERLKAAGAIVIGKTSLHEFATGGPCFDLPWPPARNPWQPGRHPGGSSSGSGTALAARMAPAALGTDTGGSVRHPATACGIVGLKPTYGAVSRRGVFPLSASLDHVGPMTRTVADCAILFEAMLGRDAADASSRDHPHPAVSARLHDGVAGLRIGILDGFNDGASPDIAAAFDVALKVLEQLGAAIQPVHVPPLADFAGCGRIILQAESFSVHETWLRTRPLDYAARTRTRILPGAFVDAATYLRAQKIRARLCAAFEAAMADVDAVLCVSSLELPCPIDDEGEITRSYERQARMPFNVTGMPALALPVGFSETGMPLGMQIAAPAFREATIFRIAQAYETETGWHRHIPPAATAEHPGSTHRAEMPA